MSLSMTDQLVRVSNCLDVLNQADIYNKCLDQIEMLIKRRSTVGRCNGASGNMNGGGLERLKQPMTHPSANPGYCYAFNLQTLYDNQLR